MKKIIIALSLFFVTNNLYAVGLGADCSSASCDANLFCLTDAFGSCKSCISFASGAYPNSAAGSTSQTNCYMNCSPLNSTTTPAFLNGYWNPDFNTVYYSVSLPTCTYTNVSHIICDTNYHLEAEECVSNTKSCTITNGTGAQYWNTTTLTWGSCVAISCNNWNLTTGYHKGVGETCISNTQTCNSVTLTNADSSANTIWTGTAWNVGSYNYSTCYKNSSYTATHGSGSKKCYWTSGTSGSDVYTTNCGYIFTSCDSGYWDNTTSDTQSDCQQTDRGYYSGNLEVYETPCPKGATSDPGAWLNIQCYYSSETNFCDQGACFHIPSSVHISGMVVTAP